MPYVAPSEAVSAGPADLAEIRRAMGQPPWRRPLVATETTRWVLWAMPAGFRQPPHWHPRADEVFHVLDGRAVFRLGGSGGEVVAGPGTVLHARPGEAHEIAVPGPGALLLLVSVTPNEDAPDETVEAPAAPAS
jgi:quercetin dioxygenase-like cupin family protein